MPTVAATPSSCSLPSWDQRPLSPSSLQGNQCSPSMACATVRAWKGAKAWQGLGQVTTPWTALSSNRGLGLPAWETGLLWYRAPCQALAGGSGPGSRAAGKRKQLGKGILRSTGAAGHGCCPMESSPWGPQETGPSRRARALSPVGFFPTLSFACPQACQGKPVMTDRGSLLSSGLP